MNSYLKFLSLLLACALVLGLSAFVLGNTFHSLIIAFALAYLLFPLIHRIEKKFHIPRTVVVIGIICVAMLILTLLAYWLVPKAAEQVSQFVMAVPSYLRLLADKLGELGDAMNIDIRHMLQKYFDEKYIVTWISEHLSDVSNLVLVPLLKLSKSGLGGLMKFLVVLINIFIVPVFFFFLVLSYEKITERLADMFPMHQREMMGAYIRQFDKVLSGFVRGQMVFSLFLSAYFSIALSLLGVKFGLLIGLATGLLCVVPYVGITVSIALVATSVGVYSQSMVFDFSMLALIYGIEAAVETPFIYPKLIGEKIGLKALEIMLALAAGVNLGGIIGAFVAIPTFAVLKILGRDAIREYKSSRFYRLSD